MDTYYASVHYGSDVLKVEHGPELAEFLRAVNDVLEGKTSPPWVMVKNGDRHAHLLITPGVQLWIEAAEELTT